MTDEQLGGELARFKQMYVDGDVTPEVYEAMIDYYLDECGGSEPSVLGRSIPASVDPDAPPADSAEHPGVRERLDSRK